MLSFHSIKRLLERVNPPPPAVDDPPGGLGIDGLPGDVGQLPCGVPVALMANDAQIYQLWMPSLLLDAVAAGPVCLLASSRRWLDSCLNHPALALAHAQGRLMIWLLGPDCVTQIQRKGLISLINDLEQVGFNPNHALFVMPANRLFQGLRAQQLQMVGAQLQRWCQRRARPMVFCLAPGQAVETDAVAALVRGMPHVFLHVATLGQRAGRPSLFLERWEGESGAFFDACYGLLPFTEAPSLRYDGSITLGKVPELVNAPDQLDVITTRSVVQGIRGVPEHWTIVESDADILPAAIDAIAATVLLDAGHIQDFSAKARLIHQLRMTHPRTLRILVRETHGKLRVHFEQTLLRLGANEVIYREVSFPRMNQLLLEGPRQSWTREIPPNCEQVLDSVIPVSARGYQRPKLFVDLVRNMVESSRGLGVTNSYVQLQLLPRVPHIDAIGANRIARDGDLLTADENALHVFLFACPEPDLELALSRVFACPLSILFISQVVSFTDASIMGILKALEGKIRHGLPDYTEALAMVAGATPDESPPPVQFDDAPQAVEILASPAVSQTTSRRITVHARPIARRAHRLGGPT
jgi:cellulose biosynthesis protein BcsE